MPYVFQINKKQCLKSFFSSLNTWLVRSLYPGYMHYNHSISGVYSTVAEKYIHILHFPFCIFRFPFASFLRRFTISCFPFCVSRFSFTISRVFRFSFPSYPLTCTANAPADPRPSFRAGCGVRLRLASKPGLLPHSEVGKRSLFFPDT